MNEKTIDTKKKGTLQKVLLILECVVIAICVIISIIVIVKPGGVSKQGGAKTTFLPVRTDSMEPTIPTGALVFTKKAPKKGEVLDLGTIITFAEYRSDQNYLNTHRIVGYKYEDAATSKFMVAYLKKGELETYEQFKAQYGDVKLVGYVTRGDKYTVEFGDETLKDFGKTKDGSDTGVTVYDDTPEVGLDEVVAVYKSHWSGVGYVLLWLMKPTNFFIIIMIPLILLLLYNIYEICRYIIGEKVKKQTAQVSLSNEEIARKAVEEYIAQQQKLAENANSVNSEISDNSDNSDNNGNNENNENNENVDTIDSESSAVNNDENEGR